MFLLIDSGTERLLAKFSDRYLLSENPEVIQKIATNRGFDQSWFPLNVKDIPVGSSQSFKCGDIDLQIFHLEPLY